MIPSINELLETAIIASLKAGKEILTVYEFDFAVEKKEDDSPLTLADKNSHKIISEILSETKIPILSEEGKNIPYHERKNWKQLWIVDPLDGTKEFVKRNGDFTVNIALAESGKPILGVIYSPVKKILYFGASKIGSYKIENIELKNHNSAVEFNTLINNSCKLPLQYPSKNKFTVVASRSHMTDETIRFIDELKKEHGEIEIISAGSSLKICLVAEGSADCYPRFGPTMEWDTAAGQAIAENAGKKLTDAKTNQPMVYNRENLRNNSFVVQ